MSDFVAFFVHGEAEVLVRSRSTAQDSVIKLPVPYDGETKTVRLKAAVEAPSFRWTSLAA